MLIYLIVIFVSFIFAYIGNKTSTKIIRYVFFSLAILLPSLLAGYRDETVGKRPKLTYCSNKCQCLPLCCNHKNETLCTAVKILNDCSSVTNARLIPRVRASRRSA